MKHPLADVLADLQKMSPEEVVGVVRKILDLESETCIAHTPFSTKTQAVTTPVTAAEKLIRIGLMLMCIEAEIGKVISEEITSRIFVLGATKGDPAKMCLGEYLET
jgi:hypothetical protein